MEIEARGLKRGDVVAAVGMKPSHFTELLHGNRHVSAAMAIRLEEFFGIPVPELIVHLHIPSAPFKKYFAKEVAQKKDYIFYLSIDKLQAQGDRT